MTVFKGTRVDKPAYKHDPYRIEYENIVEHWDCVAEIPETTVHEMDTFWLVDLLQY